MFDLQLFADGESESPAYLRGRLDAVDSRLRENDEKWTSLNKQQTQLETRLESLPDQIADRLRSHSEPSSSTPTPENPSTPPANEPENSEPKGDSQNRNAKVDPPPALPNLAEPEVQRNQNQTPPNDEPPPKAKRSLLDRLR